VEVHFLSPSELRTRDFDRVLLIKPSALGDVVHTLPVLIKLRARYPSARIDWLITPDNAEIVRHHPALSAVVLFDRRAYSRSGTSWAATASLLKSVRDIWKSRYDLVIDLHGQFRSALLTLATGAQVRIGFDRPLSIARRAEFDHASEGTLRGWAGAREGAWVAYSHRIPIPTLDIHAVDRYLWLSPILGLDDRPPDLHVYLAPDTDVRVDALLGRCDAEALPIAVVAPGTTWETKHWHVRRFAEVACQLQRRGLKVVLVGSARDAPRCLSISEMCPSVLNVCGKTGPGELAGIIRRAALCVSNDSGAMHLAVALGTPVVSVFGPTSPVRVGPYGRLDSVVRTPLPCAPCHLRKLRHCPHQHACMEQVSAEMVLARVEAMLVQSTGSSTIEPISRRAG
jgi:lipopolysaccharide heptosyltransferase I